MAAAVSRSSETEGDLRLFDVGVRRKDAEDTVADGGGAARRAPVGSRSSETESDVLFVRRSGSSPKRYGEGSEIFWPSKSRRRRREEEQ